jgi:AcrR family transcriptional regulator
MSGPVTSLRERQAEHLRASVLDAAIAALEQADEAQLSMADIAAAAGVSLRTLYRYFPDRAALLQAAGERLYASLGVPIAITAPEDISASFRDAARRLSTRPTLARALVRSRTGQATRSGVRKHRVEAIAAALEPLTASMAPDLAARAHAVIIHLCSAAAWVAVADETGLSDDDAQEAVAWAIETLIGSLSGPQRQPTEPSSRQEESS